MSSSKILVKESVVVSVAIALSLSLLGLCVLSVREENRGRIRSVHTEEEENKQANRVDSLGFFA